MNNSSSQSGEQHLLTHFVAFSKRSARHVGIGALLGIISALLYLPIATRYYEASITVGPTSAPPAMAGLGNLSGLALGGLGGGVASKLSSIIGTGGNNPVAPFDAFHSTLSSTALATRLAKRQALMHRLFSRYWNERDQKWEEPSGLTSWFKDMGRRILSLPPWSPPNTDSIANYVSNNIEIQPVSGTALITLSFKFEERSVARDFLTAVYTDAEDIVRDMDLTRSEQLITMINAQLVSSDNLPDSTKQDLISFLSQEYQTKILTTTKVAYAAAIFDPLYVSPQPYWPLPRVVLLIGTFAGALLGLMWAFLKAR